ncbi:hypothetical protein ORK51_05795 [Stenotrophomonas rhizophila]|jgi:hypothetical protein|uniref:hypothetical protein n=1 Tax=Stenotrophomonas rhizophila TaxID=216778 RepID=UPI001C0F39C6|nr:MULTISPECIES: hypothetical protein [Stenotrophomonas]MCX2919680.1 hypothetical protein [Stenotrophomonas rhizophila]
MQVDTFGAYVRAELEHWGREYALHRDGEYLGHQSKNVLQLLIEHKGDMPARAQGFKPSLTSPSAERIEDIVTDIARFDIQRACVLRGYYCGSGRRGVERLAIAEDLYRKATSNPDATLSKQRYFAELSCGVAQVKGCLWGIAKAA